MKKHGSVNANGKRNPDGFIELKSKAPIEELSARMKAGSLPKHRIVDPVLVKNRSKKLKCKPPKSKKGKGICTAWLALKYDDGSVVLLPNKGAAPREVPDSAGVDKWIKKSDLKKKQIKTLKWKKRAWPTRHMPHTPEGYHEMVREEAQQITTALELLRAAPSSAATDWRRLLVCSLAGYLSRRIVPLGLDDCPASRMRAPVFWISSYQNGDICDQLERFSKILPVTSCVVEESVKQVAPTFFPLRYTEARELDSAYLTLKKHKSVRLPVQYRDTAVIVDARKLNKAACNRFLVRNRWAVIIFFGSSKTKIKQDGIIALDGKIFGFDDVTDLDFSVLQSVIRDFQRWLLEKCKSGWFKTLGFVQHWKNLQGDVEHAKVKRGDRFWLKLQMLAVELLAKYASSVLNCDDDLDEAKIDTWVKAWTVLLLYPSGTSKGSTAGVVSTPSVVSESDFPEIFQKTVGKMLTERERFLYVPRGGDHFCPLCKPDDPDFQFWGYLRWKMGSGNRPQAPAIFFRRSKFLDVFTQNAPCPCDAKQVLEYCEEHDTAGYFPPRGKGPRKDRIPQTPGEGPVASVVLLLDRLDFLPDELRQAFRAELDEEFSDKI